MIYDYIIEIIQSCSLTFKYTAFYLEYVEPATQRVRSVRAKNFQDAIDKAKNCHRWSRGKPLSVRKRTLKGR